MPNIIVGLLAISFGLWTLSIWWYSVQEFLRGSVPLLLIAFGWVAIMAGITRVKEGGKRELNDVDLMDLEPNHRPRTTDDQSGGV